jgi:hypothetical protein
MQSTAGRSYDYRQPRLVLALSLTDGWSSAVGSGRVGNSRHISSPPSPSPYSYTAVAVLRISRDRRNRDRRDVAYQGVEYQTASSRIGRDDHTWRGRCRRSRGRSEGGLTASVNRPEAHQLDVHQCHLAGVARHLQEAGKPGSVRLSSYTWPGPAASMQRRHKSTGRGIARFVRTGEARGLGCNGRVYGVLKVSQIVSAQSA